MKVLLIAFSARQGFGSEPGLGWNTLVGLSKISEVVLVTEAENADFLTNIPRNIEVVFVPFTGSQDVIWNQGNWSFYYYYRKWQKAVFGALADRVKEREFGAIHHLNFIGFRELGEWHRLTDQVVVYGPLGGFGHASLRLLFRGGAGFSAVLKEGIKVLLNRLCFFIPRLRKGLKHANFIYAASPEAYRDLRASFSIQPDRLKFVPETGVSVPISVENLTPPKCRSIDVVFCGKPVPRKGFSIFLDVLEKIAESRSLEVAILGFDRSALTKSQSEKVHRLTHKITFMGHVHRDEVINVFDSARCMLFPSLHEGTSHAAVEAMALGVRLVCMNINSHGYLCARYGLGTVVDQSKPYRDIVDKFSIAVQNEVKESKIDRLGIEKFREENSWGAKARQYYETYQRVC